MLFEKNKQLTLVEQQTAKGKKQGLWQNDRFLYFDASLINSYYIRLKKARKWLHIFEKIGAGVFGVGCIVLFFWQAYEQDLARFLKLPSFWLETKAPLKSLFWLGIIAGCYLWYRHLAEKTEQPEIDQDSEKSNEKNKLQASAYVGTDKRVPAKMLQDIGVFMTEDAKQSLEDAYKLADKLNDEYIGSIHVFIGLLSST
ncbi:MAG: hypothetical protein COU33_03350, partial [Candidatus Magasanikbacteria bacterium CG10_big_fil_rev_8_21_14_0_10_43_6]